MERFLFFLPDKMQKSYHLLFFNFEKCIDGGDNKSFKNTLFIRNYLAYGQFKD